MVINENGLITENQNEQKDTLKNTNDVQAINNQDNVTIENNKNFDLDNSNNQLEENENNHVQTINNNVENENSTNCIALTVRKDYNLSIFKNSIFTTLRVSWKIAISTFILNILKLFL